MGIVEDQSLLWQLSKQFHQLIREMLWGRKDGRFLYPLSVKDIYKLR